jgi:hypothetical protein
MDYWDEEHAARADNDAVRWTRLEWEKLHARKNRYEQPLYRVDSAPYTAYVAATDKVEAERKFRKVYDWDTRWGVEVHRVGTYPYDEGWQKYPVIVNV